MKIELKHHHKKGSDGKPVGPILIDRVYLDGEPVGWLARQDRATFAPTAKLDRAALQEVAAKCAKLRAEEGTYLPGGSTGGGVPSPEALREALDQIDDMETEKDEYDDE